VEPIHRVPVDPLPRSDVLVEREVEDGKDRLVNLLGIDLHHRLGDPTDAQRVR